MENKTKTIIATIDTPFGKMTRETIYTPKEVSKTGGIYLTNRNFSSDEQFIDILTDLFRNGYTYGDIMIDNNEVSFDIIMTLFDEKGQELSPNGMDRSLLRDVIQAEVSNEPHPSVVNYTVNHNYYLDGKKIILPKNDIQIPSYFPVAMIKSSVN